jgi:hypothetical protein
MSEKQHSATPDTPEFALNKQNRHAINAIRGTMVDLSNAVRKDVARWCVQAENKPEFPWAELFSIVENSHVDLNLLTNASEQFKEYAERRANGRVKAIDLTPLPLETTTAENTASIQPEVQVTALSVIEPANTTTVEARVNEKVLQVVRNAGLRSIYHSSAHQPKDKAAGGEK